jgi:hypothetical protein
MRKTAVKKLARREIHDEPQLVEELIKNGASLSSWRSAFRLPSLRIAILELPTGRIFGMRRPQDVSRALKAMGMSIADATLIISLFEKIRPGRRYPLLTREQFFLSRPPPTWHPPKLKKEGLVFFCNNPVSGFIERIVVDGDLTVQSTKFAKGEKIHYR